MPYRIGVVKEKELDPAEMHEQNSALPSMIVDALAADLTVIKAGRRTEDNCIPVYAVTK